MIVSGIVSNSTQVDEGQLLRIKASEIPETVELGYYQLQLDSDSPLLLVLRQNAQEGLISALIATKPVIHPGSQVQLIPRAPAAGVIQGPIVHSFTAGEGGCALQIKNFGDAPEGFDEGSYVLEVQRMQGSVRVPVAKQRFSYSFSGSELLTAVLGPDYRPEDYPVASWAVFHRV